MSVKITYNNAKIGPRSRNTFDRSNIVLVEGQSDLSLIKAQVLQIGLADKFQVHVMNGNTTDWAGAIQVILDDDEFSKVGRSLGVVLDADDSPESALKRGWSALASVSPGVKNVESGHVEGDGQVNAGVYIVAGPDGKGSLEDLVMPALDSARLSSAEQYLDNVENVRRTAFEARRKNLTLAYLASESGFVASLETALRIDRVIPGNAACFSALRDFLRNLDQRPD